MTGVEVQYFDDREWYPVRTDGTPDAAHQVYRDFLLVPNARRLRISTPVITITLPFFDHSPTGESEPPYDTVVDTSQRGPM